LIIPLRSELQRINFESKQKGEVPEILFLMKQVLIVDLILQALGVRTDQQIQLVGCAWR